MSLQRSFRRHRSSRQFRRQGLDRDSFKVNLIASHLSSGLNRSRQKPLDRPGGVQPGAGLRAGMGELGWVSSFNEGGTGNVLHRHRRFKPVFGHSQAVSATQGASSNRLRGKHRQTWRPGLRRDLSLRGRKTGIRHPRGGSAGRCLRARQQRFNHSQGNSFCGTTSGKRQICICIPRGDAPGQIDRYAQSAFRRGASACSQIWRCRSGPQFLPCWRSRTLSPDYIDHSSEDFARLTGIPLRRFKLHERIVEVTLASWPAVLAASSPPAGVGARNISQRSQSWPRPFLRSMRGKKPAKFALTPPPAILGHLFQPLTQRMYNIISYLLKTSVN